MSATPAGTDAWQSEVLVLLRCPRVGASPFWGWRLLYLYAILVTAFRIGDTICAIMNVSKISKLRNSLDSLRASGGIKVRELQKLARGVGRKLQKRGKEPTWVNEDFSHWTPLSIPDHSGDLNRNTARSILDQLEEDLDNLEIISDEKD